MDARRITRIAGWIGLILVLLAIPAAITLYRKHRVPITIQGGVIVRDADPNKQLPIPDVQVTVAGGLAAETVKSDSSGYFSMRLRNTVRRGHPLTLSFRNPNYRPLDLRDYVGDQLYIARMVPLSQAPVPRDEPRTTVGNVRVRYLSKAMTTVNIGSAVKTFEVQNAGNTPCHGRNPCSPDGKWKASVGGASLDAGAGNEFRNARVSCIAGPCAFTRIDADQFSRGGQTISVVARDWSDTATFLLEAEVFHPMVSDLVHESYPVIFGRTMSFSLPSTAQGVSIQADVGGTTIIFPLGPALLLSWADCTALINPEEAKVYRCALKRGYQFR